MNKIPLLVLTIFVSLQSFCQCSVTATWQNTYCGLCNGSATAIATGTSPFSYSWSNGQTSQTDTALCAGMYTVTVTDSNNCISSATAPVTNNNNWGVFTSTTNASCNGCCDGTAIITPYGGYPPYTYLWSPGAQTTDSIGNLCAGNYFAQISDTYGCIRNIPITITEPPLGDYLLSGSNSGITIFPNPSNGIVNFGYQSLDETSYAIAKVYNMQGELVNEFRLECKVGSVVKDFSSLPNGLYFYSIIANNNSIASSKFVILK